MARITLSCSGVPSSAGEEAARDITREFEEHRQWFTNVQCSWDGSRLILSADSDFDRDGDALRDEFSDCIAAYVAEGFNGELRVESIINPPSA